MTQSTRDRVAEAYERLGGNISAISRDLGISRSTVQHHVARLGYSKPLTSGTVTGIQVESRDLPQKGAVKRYICSSVQNNTHVAPKVWANIKALADFYEAEIFLSSFSYNQNAYGKLSVKKGTKKAAERELWYDPEVEPHLVDRMVQLAPGLVWCGHMNIIPTNATPLTGYENYTGRSSGIFPHVRIAMDSVPSAVHEPTKFNYATGTVTKMNYIQKGAGLKAEFHHCYGALLVEVDDEGRWYCRQLNADGKGRIYDLGWLAEDGEVYDEWGKSVQAITWGDLHLDYIEEMVRRLAWAEGGMLDTLKPKEQHFHDAVDLPRNHHDMRNPHRMYEAFVNGMEGVEASAQRIADFLGRESYRPWCKSVVVESNHDEMLERWLREADFRKDPLNSIFFLECELAKRYAIRDKDRRFLLCEHVMRKLGCPEAVKWLRPNDTHVICRDSKGGIECAHHGHAGPRGARGSKSNFKKLGRRVNRGHDHGAGINDGVVTAGTCSQMELSYVNGPGDWSWSHIITYVNGKRAIATMWQDKWRA